MPLLRTRRRRLSWLENRPRPAFLQVLWLVGTTAAAGALVAQGPPPARGSGHRGASARGALLARSGDAYVREERTATGVRWRFGTAQVEKLVQFDSGHLTLTGFLDRAALHEYVQGPSDMLAFTWNGGAVTGRSVTWTLDGATTRKLDQGELLLQLALHTTSDPQLAIVKSYLLYPKESIVQEWLQITNRSSRPATLAAPAALTMHVLQQEAPAIDFTAWQGGPVTESLTAAANREFNGYATVDYGPIQIYQNRETKHGLFVGWDYTGLWHVTVGTADGQPGYVNFHVAAYHRTLRPDETVETPKAFTGVFHGDFDAMGRQLLDYQYRYKWDYTRAPYFPSIALEGYWRLGGQRPWAEGMDVVSNFRKVFRGVDMMRTIGADNFWRDYGWWDKQGEWNGPNFQEAGRYLSQYGMRQTIYIAVQTADSTSRVAREHPEWIASDRRGHPFEGLFFDQSQAAVRDWELRLLEAKRQQWGNFEWRKDWTTTVFMRDSAGGLDSSRMLAQDQSFRHLVQTFLDRYPGMGFHGCDGGASDLSYEMLRFGSNWQLGEGGASGGHYWASYLFPPDKLDNVPDEYLLERYEKGWRGLLWGRMALTAETDDPAKLDGIRRLVEIGHYLMQHGVLGRWAFVYHPRVTGDDASGYLERLSGDGRRGAIIPAHAQAGPVTIYPKGLLPDLVYDVSYQESNATARRSGTDLMAQGIALPSVPEGEIIYLNLPLHPGSSADRTAPAAPGRVTQQVATHMDYSGVELRWSPGRDDNWISYYQIYRDGVPLDKVAKGTYYFDHSLGADLAARYAVATVDGSGNRSQPVPALAVAREAALVVDDTSAALIYHGRGWKHETGQWGAAYGTQAGTRTVSDSLQYTFTGSRVSWYGRLGRNNGVAAVYLDGKLDQLVNTYNADEFPNVVLYSRAFAGIERHTLTIVATGVQLDPVELPDQERDRGWIVVDGLQVDQTAPRVVGATSRSGITYRGRGWPPADTAVSSSAAREQERSSSGGVRSDHAGDEAAYTFTGTGITWVGRRCSRCGMADVYVDGSLVTSVDQYVRPVVVNAGLSTDQQQHVPLFTRCWTRRGRHTLRIVVRADANLWAEGHKVYLDALHVRP